MRQRKMSQRKERVRSTGPRLSREGTVAAQRLKHGLEVPIIARQPFAEQIEAPRLTHSAICQAA